LVAATDGELVTRLDNVNEWIALGETVARLGEIPEERVEQLVRAMREFKRVATQRKAEGLYVFATEAMRAASNHREVLRTILRETGVEVEIISPRREAELSCIGIQLDTEHINPTVMIEVGGGSAQAGLVNQGTLGDEISLPLGTGRVVAQTGVAGLCSAETLQEAKEWIHAEMIKIPFDPAEARIVASGGVARGIWRALHPDGEKEIQLFELDYLVEATSRLPVDRVIERFNVKPKRAGTLLVGSMVYGAFLRRFDATSMLVSEFGVREGAVIQMAKGMVSLCRL
jgi:exopolyphosphatase/guanosine-5'-triphosphate,3'-diphosphate pyrophosphatase